MDPTASPGILGAFVTSFLGLVGVVVWIIRQQLGQSQKLIETIPDMQKMFVAQMDKQTAQAERLATTYQDQLAKDRADYRAAQAEDREFYAKQLDTIAKAFAATQRDTAAAIKALAEATATATKAVSDHAEAVDRHADRLSDDREDRQDAARDRDRDRDRDRERPRD